MRSCSLSVSPLLCPIIPAESANPRNAAAGLDGVDVVLNDDVHDLKGVAVTGDPIVGTEVITLDDRGVGAVQPTHFHRQEILPLPNERNTI